MLVVLPAGLAVAAAAVIVAALLQEETATAPGGDEPGARDHWHAVYEFVVCGAVQPPAPEWVGGVHTHGDGIIHIHPFEQSEEGEGARLVKWFEYGFGVLDDDEVRLPGTDTTYRNGDECPDGSAGVVQVFVNGERLAGYTRYIPADGDRVQIIFGPERELVRALTAAGSRLY